SMAILSQASMKSAGVNFALDALTPSVYNTKRQTGDLLFFTDELDSPVVPDGHYELTQFSPSRALQPTLIKFESPQLVDPISAKLNTLDPQTDTKAYNAALRQAQ